MKLDEFRAQFPALERVTYRGRLKERSVIGAVRDGSLRLGFHAYNDETDLRAALDALGQP